MALVAPFLERHTFVAPIPHTGLIVARIHVGPALDRVRTVVHEVHRAPSFLVASAQFGRSSHSDQKTGRSKCE